MTDVQKRLEAVLRERGFEFVSARAFDGVNSLRVLFRHGPAAYSTVEVTEPFFDNGEPLGERLCTAVEGKIRAFAMKAEDATVKTARREVLVEAAKFIRLQGLHYGEKTVRELGEMLIELSKT